MYDVERVRLKMYGTTPKVISHLGNSLLRSTSCSEELVHFFYFSVGFDIQNMTISNEGAPDVPFNLSSTLTDCLCLAGLTRQRANIACQEMLADAHHQIENTLPATEHVNTRNNRMNSSNSANSSNSTNSTNSTNNMEQPFNLQELLNLC